jgi:hypothetical protein
MGGMGAMGGAPQAGISTQQLGPEEGLEEPEEPEEMATPEPRIPQGTEMPQKPKGIATTAMNTHTKHQQAMSDTQLAHKTIPTAEKVFGKAVTIDLNLIDSEEEDEDSDDYDSDGD